MASFGTNLGRFAGGFLQSAGKGLREGAVASRQLGMQQTQIGIQQQQADASTLNARSEQLRVDTEAYRVEHDVQQKRLELSIAALNAATSASASQADISYKRAIVYQNAATFAQSGIQFTENMMFSLKSAGMKSDQERDLAMQVARENHRLTMISNAAKAELELLVKQGSIQDAGWEKPVEAAVRAAGTGQEEAAADVTAQVMKKYGFRGAATADESLEAIRKRMREYSAPDTSTVREVLKSTGGIDSTAASEATKIAETILADGDTSAINNLLNSVKTAVVEIDSISYVVDEQVKKALRLLKEVGNYEYTKIPRRK